MVVMGGGVQNHFHIQPNYSVEVVLSSVVVGVVTKNFCEKCIVSASITFRAKFTISVCKLH